MHPARYHPFLVRNALIFLHIEEAKRACPFLMSGVKTSAFSPDTGGTLTVHTEH